MSQIQELAHLQIPLQSIKLATDNFADQNFIGQGGFGRVYKGQIPHPITEQETAVAVKRLDVNNMITGQGQNEFLKEIVTLASYKHDNIVTLIGFCDEDDEKVLVYKHEVNGSLDKHLHICLTWEQRLHICLDVARGLKYLHEDVGVGHRVIHRDMKSSNILLDENMKAKISDFGLCKIGPRSEQFSILVTKAAGTLGYVDPQYSETGVLTKESDVYALGIVLCEDLCGRFACIPTYGDRRTFLSLLVTHHYENRSIDRVIFPCLQKQMKPYSLDTFVRIAFDCMNKDRRHRPTMGTVLKELEAALEHQTVLKIGKRTMLWGSTSGGTLWTFMVNNNQKLTNITINYHSWIHSISFTKKDLDSELSCSQTHGGDSRRKGKIYEINFDDDEEIIGISGTIGTHHDHELVSSLCFVTNKREHGPFGTTANTGFSASWDVGLCVGFHGRCGWELDAIGCYLV